MNFDSLLTKLGFASVNGVESLAWAIAGIVIAGSIGWLASQYLSPPFAALMLRLTGKTSPDADLLPAQVRDMVIALLLTVFRGLMPLDLLGMAIVSSLAALAMALVAKRGLRWAGSSPSWAVAVAVLVFLLVVTGSLGGLDRLEYILGSIGITIGARRLTFLSIISLSIFAVILFFGAKLLSRVANNSIEKSSLDPSQQVLAQKLVGIVIIVSGFFLAIDAAGIDLTAFKVFSGAVGLAVGFGLQKTFGNLIAGVILLMDRSIKPGDVIVVGDTFGAVNKIGVRAVSVVTRDGKEHLIPNENLMTQEVENWSYSSREVRIHIPVGVSYGCNIKIAQRLMAEAATESARVLPEPAPTVWLKGFGDNSVDHEILVWIGDPENGTSNIQSEILNRLWDLFAENNIEIPFPQRDIHIRSLPTQP